MSFLRVVYSNRVEQLYAHLSKTLFSLSQDLFVRRLLLVPNEGMKSWLMLKMAQDPTLGVAAGCHILPLNEGMQELSCLLSSAQLSPYIPSYWEVALAIEGEIRTLWESSPTFSSQEAELWQPLFCYLGLQEERPLARRDHRRLSVLAEGLASLFLRYGKYGAKLLAAWRRADQPVDWQQALWKRLFHPDSLWTCPSQLFNALPSSLSPPTGQLHIHLFAVGHLPPLYYHFLEALAEKLPVCLYLLSPCQAFWSDIRSDRENVRMQQLWKQRGVSSLQLEDLETYLHQSNPLLANFGKIGRERASLIENSLALCEEDYVFPALLAESPHYTELLSDSFHWVTGRSPPSLLETLQADLLVMRKPQEAIAFGADDTIQVQVACSPLREVQVIYDLLLGRMLQDSLKPEEILVMAPDIRAYVPWIEMVFQQEDNPLNIHILEGKRAVDQPLFQAFFCLLALAFGRWDVLSVLQLLDMPSFQGKHHLQGEEIEWIKRWIKESGISWGFDGEQRQEFLHSQHCPKVEGQTSAQGTWEKGFERLLASLVLSDPSGSKQAELLGRWIELMRSLYVDLKLLSDETALTLAEWSHYLQALMDTYFAYDEEREAYAHFLESLRRFRRASLLLSTQRYPFASIRRHLVSVWESLEMAPANCPLQSIRFCSLSSFKALPAKVIVLMGMHEGAYPRQERIPPFNRMTEEMKGDYCPSAGDEDRYIFLEVLLSARSHVLITYPSLAQMDGQEQGPSSVVQELLEYLDQMAEIEGQKPSLVCVNKHPFLAFHSSYFEPQARVRSYSPTLYRMARAFYQSQKRPTPCFLSQFASPNSPSVGSGCLDFRELSAFVKDPIKTYFNRTLGIYLAQEEHKRPGEAKLQLSALDSFYLRREALKQPFEHLYTLWEEGGEMPEGIFNTIERRKMQEQDGEMRANLLKAGITPDTLFSIEFSEQVSSPRQTPEGNWLFPSICMEGSSSINLVGKIDLVHDQGLIVPGARRSKEAIKAWPQYLAVQHSAHLYSVPICPQMIFTLADNPLLPVPVLACYDRLLTLVRYYFMGLSAMSPLISEWVELMMKYEGEKLAKEIDKKANHPLYPLHHAYLQWMQRGRSLPDILPTHLQWKCYAQEVFKELLEVLT
jgi:exodeoxyribonuclease V gamma subunit